MDIVTPGKYWPIGQYLYSPLIGPEAGGHGLVMADAELMVMCEDLVKAVTSDKLQAVLPRQSSRPCQEDPQSLRHHWRQVNTRPLLVNTDHMTNNTRLSLVSEQKVVTALRMWDSLPGVRGQISTRLQALGLSDQVNTRL